MIYYFIPPQYYSRNPQPSPISIDRNLPLTDEVEITLGEWTVQATPGRQIGHPTFNLEKSFSIHFPGGIMDTVNTPPQ
jgi:hypothetical protein